LAYGSGMEGCQSDFIVASVGVSEDQLEVAPSLLGFIVFFAASASRACGVACSVALLTGPNWDAIPFVLVHWFVQFLRCCWV
jgi:hypothetical protein